MSHAEPIGWRRLNGPTAGAALGFALVGAIAEALGSVVLGRLTEGSSAKLVALLGLCVISAALCVTVGSILWAGVSDRAEGRLRGELLAAALAQPVQQLSAQSAGEILDRVDDDTHDVGSLVRRQVWSTILALSATGPTWVVAGLTWWPAWFLFPATVALCWWLVRGILDPIAQAKFDEEVAWTDHAAILEEGIAARDDLRTSLGAEFVLRRSTELAAVTIAKIRKVVGLEVSIVVRASLAQNALLIGLVVAGVVLVTHERMDVTQLVTLFFVTIVFLGHIFVLSEQLPELQAGVGAVMRLRQLMNSEREPTGGDQLADGELDIRITNLDFAYPDGKFRLHVDDLTVPAGQTLALVGRSGSGKSTLASVLSRAVEPDPGTVWIGGADITTLSLSELRRAVGVVTQRTEIIAGTLAENIALFADLPRDRVQAAIDELGLTDWVASLPNGLDSTLGPGGLSLSSGEEQIVALARLLVRDVRVVVLDEATARMDPHTEKLVVGAAARLLSNRTGVIIAHRLVTAQRADHIAVLSAGNVVEQGSRTELAARSADDGQRGYYRQLLDDAAEAEQATPVAAATGQAPQGRAKYGRTAGEPPTSLGTVRRTTTAPRQRDAEPTSRFAKVIWRLLMQHKSWGLFGAALFTASALIGFYGPITAFVWGRLVQELAADSSSRPIVWWLLAALIALFLLWTPIFAVALRQYMPWWSEALFRVRTNVLMAQTAPRRLRQDPPGEVAARALDADRLARYADRWVDFLTGLVVVIVTTVFAGNLLAAAVMVTVMVTSALASSLGRSVAGRSATAAAAARADFGRVLVSALDATRTVKLADATGAIHRHLRTVDAPRIRAARREHRVQAALDGVPMVIVQCAVVAVWAIQLADGWDVATAVMLSVAVVGFDYFGLVTGWVITEAPGTRAWHRETSKMAAGSDLVRLPPGVDLVTGTAPGPPPVGAPETLRRLALSDVSVVHEDGAIGVEHVSMQVAAGDLVLLVGRVGSGKSSLLRAVAGLVDHTGVISWNGQPIADTELFCRPGQVAYVAQVPRVLSGSYADNIVLDHLSRDARTAAETARLSSDVDAAGGFDAVVGHRGVRLSGGQVQRLALARALASEAELILADDVSSALDATTELELWDRLRSRGVTVIGSTSKRVALAAADSVVVLDQGSIVAQGPWPSLAKRWGHLAG